MVKKKIAQEPHAEGATKFIDDLKVVTDLEEGQRAVPERNMTYVVYPTGGGVELPVACVIRRGEHFYAVSVAGVERCIAGEGAKFEIRGRYTGKTWPRSP